MTGTDSQDEVFVASESDRYFERNRAALQAFDPEADLPLRLLGLYGLDPRSVVEIGAGNGARVGTIGQRTGSDVVAIEPSNLAVADGKDRYPWVQFIRAEAAAVPISRSFDLVIVNFMLHWIDRANLLAVVAEIDRLVADGGYLLIGDFSPSVATRVPYHHLPGSLVSTFKQDYGALFAASALYHQVAMLTASHSGGHLRADVGEGERTCVCLMRKQLQEHYARSSHM